MDELERARTEVATHREGLRKTEAELKEARLERESLTSSGGLFGLFASAPDPAKLEEVDTVIAVLQEEVRIRRQTLHEALQKMERMEADAARGAILPPGIDDLDRAVLCVQALRKLEPLLRDLERIASKADQARDAVPLTKRAGRNGRRADPHAAAKRGSAVYKHTEDWERLVDEAELMADVAGIPLVLPRRWDAQARPDHGPQPAPDVALARQQALAGGNQDFGLAIAFVRTDLEALQRKGWNIVEAVIEKFPEASALAAERPFEPMEAGRGGQGPQQAGPALLEKHWTGLREAHTALAALVGRGARTVDYLDTLGLWQRHAQQVHKLPIAQRHGLLPPLNDGGDLQRFLATLLKAWPELDARYESQRAEGFGPPTAAAAPTSAPAQDHSAFTKRWEDLRKAHDALATLAARGSRMVDYLDPMAAWQRHATAIAAMPFAQEHGLAPPVNDGGALTPFVEQVLETWPDLDARYRFAVGRR